MAESRLDPYREEIVMLLGQGVAQAEIARILKERFGVEARRSTLSDYIKTLSEGAVKAGLNGEGPGVAFAPAVAESDATAALMQSAGEEILDRLAQVIEGLQQVKREGEETAQRVQDTLKEHTRAFDALFGTFKGAVLGKIWLRAALVTGTFWGVGLAAFYVYRWGLPLWADKLW